LSDIFFFFEVNLHQKEVRYAESNITNEVSTRELGRKGLRYVAKTGKRTPRKVESLGEKKISGDPGGQKKISEFELAPTKSESLKIRRLRRLEVTKKCIFQNTPKCIYFELGSERRAQGPQEFARDDDGTDRAHNLLEVAEDQWSLFCLNAIYCR
jgi:hypothetical protein